MQKEAAGIGTAVRLEQVSIEVSPLSLKFEIKVWIKLST
jgi:hypothetical protein